MHTVLSNAWQVEPLKERVRDLETQLAERDQQVQALTDRLVDHAVANNVPPLEVMPPELPLCAT